MFKVIICKSVVQILEKEVNKNVFGETSWEVSASIDTYIRTYEVLKRINNSLKENPYQYPKLQGNIRVIIEAYFPYLLLYRINNDEVTIFDLKNKNDYYLQR